MALLWRSRDEHVEWGVWKMDESIEQLRALLPADCYRRFASPVRTQEWLAVRALFSELTGNCCTIDYRSDGKPFLVDSLQQISISHTSGYAAVALSLFPVGIDIEVYGTQVNRVAKRFIRADEAPVSPTDDVTLWRLLVWSGKETVYKCLEAPDADFRTLRIEPFEINEHGHFTVRRDTAAEAEPVAVNYRLHTDFVLTWATRPKPD